MKDSPLVLHIFNINVLFLCAGIAPVWGKTAWIAGILLLVSINGVSLLAARRRLQRLNDAVLRRAAVKNWILALTSIIVTFGALELMAHALTTVGLVQSYSAMRTVLPAGVEDWRMAHITADRYREPDPVLFWRPIDRRPYTSQRFKGPEVQPAKPAGTFRILCYGDSNTDGPDRGGWPERLHALLPADGGYEVLNAGVAGYSSHQGLVRFRSEAGRFQPDLVLVSFGWNDPAPALGSPDKDFQMPSSLRVGVERWLIHYRFYRVARYYLRPRAPVPRKVVVPRVSREDYLDNLKGFVETARAHQIEVVFLTRPHRELEAVLREDVRSWKSRVPDYNQDLRRFGREAGIPAIDVQGNFSQRPDLFVDECHFTPAGHRKMAALLYDALSRAGKLRAGRGRCV
ncbi:MAG: hypothetical protein GY856_12580 [bacterium]|nr:hypothetical protein [bacterium]